MILEIWSASVPIAYQYLLSQLFSVILAFIVPAFQVPSASQIRLRGLPRLPVGPDPLLQGKAMH